MDGFRDTVRAYEALVSSGRFRVRTGVTVREVHRTATGFVLVAGAATAPERIDADHVVLATPAAPTARLLRNAAPVAAAELEGIETASVAVVTLAVRAAGAPTLAGSDSSGFLVPPEERRAVKASTYSFNKWAWVRSAGRETGEDLLFLRTSLGRHREEAALQATDEELVERSLADLADAVGLTARPVDWHVQRWGGGLPQYAEKIRSESRV